MLHHNEADLAITVTDGFIAGQAAGFNVQLVGTYVDSPLTWAVSAHPNSPYKTVEEMFQNQEKIKVGISRLQSGSHTMSYYLADLLTKQSEKMLLSSQTWQKNQMQFKELGSFSNLRNGISNSDIDIFLWEVFTTKPYFDSGALKLIGEVSTPWPAFSIIASNSGHFLSGQDSRATEMFRNRFLPALAEGATFFKNNVTTSSSSGAGLRREVQYDSNAVCDDSVSLIVKRFGHKREDAQRWLQRTHYALPDMSVDAERMRRALSILQAVGLVPEVYPVRYLWGEKENVLCNDAISFRHTSEAAHSKQSTLTASSVIESEILAREKNMSSLLRTALML